MRGKRAIFGGRREVRRGLRRAALATIRFNAVVQRFYDRLLAAGKPGKVAIDVCMRKLLTILNAMLRSRKSWDDPPHHA